MAWYDVNFRCGHQDRTQLYGPVRERRSRIEYLEANMVCPECYKAEQERARAVATAAAKEANQGSALPKLEGTPKQVDWAERIRASAKEHLEWVIGVYDEEREARIAEAQHGPVFAKSELVAFAQRILRQDESRYWIDRRGDFASKEQTARYLARRLREERAKSEGAKALQGGQQ